MSVTFNKQLGLWMPTNDTHFRSPRLFELPHCQEIVKLIPAGRRMIDGGAHVGSWSRHLVQFAAIEAFEPDPINYLCLEKNTSGIHLHNCALGASAGRAGMSGKDGNSGARWLIEGDDIDIVSLDSFGFDDVDFIKFDLEGYEPHALIGARRTIEHSWPIVLIEQTPPLSWRYGFDYREGGRMLTAMGYLLHAKLNKNYIYRRRECQ